MTITVNPVNDPPVANPDLADITEEAPNVAAANTVSGNVLTNDTDPDSSLTVSAVAGGSVGVPRAGSYGSVTINSNGSYTYTLDDSNPMVNGLAPGQMLTDPFGYTASDGSLTSSSTLTVTIHGADDPATPDNDASEFIGNTQLEVDRDTAATPEVLATTPLVDPALGVLDGDLDPDGGPAISISSIVGCGDLTAPFDCILAGQGTVSLQADGSFSFIPEPGDPDPTATFQYTLTGNPNPATVTLTRFERVWFVDPNADAGGNGTSALPFNSLTTLNGAGGAGDSDLTGDYIFIHDGTLAGSIEMENNQHLIGEGVGLTVPVIGTFNGSVNPSVSLVPAGTKPQLTNASGDTVRVTTQIPIEIVGLSLASTTGNAIDLTSGAALTGSATLTIGSNDVPRRRRRRHRRQPERRHHRDADAQRHRQHLGPRREPRGELLRRADRERDRGAAAQLQQQHEHPLHRRLGRGDRRLRRRHGDDHRLRQQQRAPEHGGHRHPGHHRDVRSRPAAAGSTRCDGGTTVIGASGNGVGGSGMVLGNVPGDLGIHRSRHLRRRRPGPAGRRHRRGQHRSRTGTRVTVGAVWRSSRRRAMQPWTSTT